MSDNIVGLNGQPVEPEVEYDQGLMDLVNRATELIKTGHCNGIAIVTVGPHTSGFELEGNYHGPRLTLLSACARLQHKLNNDLDKVSS